MRVIVVIPALNKGKALTEASVRDALAFSDGVVVVDDGSTDDTADISPMPGVVLLRHVVNRGQGAALQTGMDFALHELQADIVVHFDADGQMKGEEIPDLVLPIKNGEADVVLGSRFLGRPPHGMPLTRRLSLRLGTWFTVALSGIRVTDTHNGFRALSADAARSMRITLDRMAHASEILDLIVARRLRYVERPVTILYTDESLARGQTTLHALGTAKDILKKKFLG